MIDWNLKQLLFADDTALIADSEEKLLAVGGVWTIEWEQE